MRYFVAAWLMFAIWANAMADTAFDTHFNDSTLRVDYILGGGPQGPRILLDRQSKTPGWYGKRHRLAELPQQGNGSITVTDPVSGDTLYRYSFSTLFSEWEHIPEAKEISKSFENTFLVPLPKQAADITLTLLDNRHQPEATLTHRYRPDDELIAQPAKSSCFSEYVYQGADPKEVIDIAIIAEGYTTEEQEKFLKDSKRFADEILSYEPFKSRSDKFNFLAVMVPSRESGVSVPLEKDWKDTAFGSHYSTFYSARYLTSPKVHKMHDVLAGLPYEHLMVLVNTPRYGGGGIYNSYQMAAADNEHSLPVTVHEFGHSFGGLADEYFYQNEEDDTYCLDIEPWEPNITTLVDFDSKWKGMPGTGLFEGGGYKLKGIYRPVDTCRMRDNYHPTFCPVCTAAIARVIDFYTKP